MSNQFVQRPRDDAFGQQATPPPTEDKYFAGDQLVDPRDVVQHVTTQYWRKDGKTGQMRPMKFKPNPRPGEEGFEFPKTMYAPLDGDLGNVTVYDPDEERQALEMGYVDAEDHRERQKVQMKGIVKNKVGQFDVAATSGELKPVEGTFTTGGKRRGRPPGSAKAAVVDVQPDPAA